MEVIEDYTTLRKRLRYLGRPAVIGVEGFTGSGKTRLSDDLARDIGGSTIHADEYVTDEDESLTYSDRPWPPGAGPSTGSRTEER